MVQKWTLCIEVSCYPNPGQAIIAYLLHNMELNLVLQTKRGLHGKTTNNEAYYISLVERIKTSKKHGANNNEVFNNSELIGN
jgi:ribonuclease HI